MSPDSMNYYAPFDYMNPGPSGANVIWDFSAATVLPYGNPFIVFTPVSGTPYASQYGASNICENLGSGWAGSGLSSVLEYSYYNASQTALQYYGDGDSAYNAMSDPQDQLRYPFTYGDSYQDASVQKYWNGSDSILEKGKMTVIADAYGTLIMASGLTGTASPIDTFYNVLRVHYNRKLY